MKSRALNILASILTAVAATFFAQAAQAQGKALPAGTYKLDKSHASLIFKVPHMGFSNYTANFDDFDATLEIDPAKPENAKLVAIINPNSLDLPSPPDGFTKEILGDKWLNSAKFPTITFTSNKIETTDKRTAKVYGDLEILGVKKPIVLSVAFNGGYLGQAMDPHARIGFSAVGAFNRSDFGMSYGIPAAGSNMGVGDMVNVAIEAEFKGPTLKSE